MHRGYQTTYEGVGGMYKYLIYRRLGFRIRKAMYDSDHWIFSGRLCLGAGVLFFPITGSRKSGAGFGNALLDSRGVKCSGSATRWGMMILELSCPCTLPDGLYESNTGIEMIADLRSAISGSDHAFR